MKKLCITFTVLGIILTIAGAAMTAMFSSYANDDIDIFEQRSRNNSDTAVTTTFATTAPVEEPYFNSGDGIFHNYAPSTKIKGININANAADVTIYNDPESFMVSCDNIDAQFYTEEIIDGILTINYKPELKNELKDLINMETPKIYIFVPSSDFVKLSINAGDIDLYDMTLKTLEIDTDAGEIDINNCTVTDSADFSMTAGETYINSCTLNNTSINKTAGDVYAYDSVMTGATKIESTAGNCNFDLIGNIDDYRFDLVVTAGDITVNDSPAPNGNNSSAPNSFCLIQTAGNCKINIY